jgi:hypothetical protein
MVIEISANDKRPDWHQIPEIRQAYAHIQELYLMGERTKTEAAPSVFRRTAATCNDLIRDDARSRRRPDRLRS